MRNHCSPNALSRGGQSGQLTLFQIADLNNDPGIASTDGVLKLLGTGAAVAISVSGGKDSNLVRLQSARLTIWTLSATMGREY